MQSMAVPCVYTEQVLFKKGEQFCSINITVKIPPAWCFQAGGMVVPPATSINGCRNASKVLLFLSGLAVPYSIL
jgi:hypothetical protein